MKSISIGFSRPKSLLRNPGALLIMAYQGFTPYSHVYIKLYSSYTEETLIYQASHGMVNCTNLNNFHEHIVKEFERSVEDSELKATVKYAQQLLGRPYGYLGLLKLLLARGLRAMGMFETWSDDMDDFFCSQFVSTLFPDLAKEIGLPAQNIQPSDLYKALTN